MRSASPPASEPVTYHRYRRWSVVALGLGYLVVWFTITQASETISDFGVLLWLVVMAVSLVLDLHGVLSLRGRLYTRQLSRLASTLIIFFCWPLSILWLIPYLIVAGVDTYRGESAGRQERLAALEGELGFLPVSDGTCAHCHRPLQAGAEYCAYCGAAVAPPLQVCPACHERTFPDALWCPHCGAALPATGAAAPRRTSS